MNFPAGGITAPVLPSNINPQDPMSSNPESFALAAFCHPDYAKPDPANPKEPLYKLPDLKDRKPAKITAVRLCNDIVLGAHIMVAANDCVDAVIYEGGVATGGTTLATRFLSPSEEITIVVRVQNQGLVTIAMPDWFPDCCTPFMLTLGTFCPLDSTDSTGMKPTNRNLYWGVAGSGTRPPAKTMEFKFDGQGRLTCAHLNSEHTMYLRVGTATGAAKLSTTHIVLATRDGETGSISLPAFGGKPAAELKL